MKFSLLFIIFVLNSSNVYFNEQKSEFIESLVFECSQNDVILQENSILASDVVIGNNYKGKVVEFTHSKGVGYYIYSTAKDDKLSVIDYSFYSHSPFFEKAGDYYFPSLNSYVVVNNGKINTYDYKGNLLSDINLNRAIIEGNVNKEFATINTSNYVKKESIKKDYDSFYYMSNNVHPELTNYCANIAGVEMLDYRNYKFNNRLLNLRSSDLDNGHISRNKSYDYIKMFYNKMNTNGWLIPNSNVGGTHPANAVVAFREYIKQLGFECNVRQLYKVQDYETEINDNSLLFLTTFDGSFLPYKSGFFDKNILSFNYDRYSGIGFVHAFVGFGVTSYKDKEFIKPNEEFLHIANGWSNNKTGGYYLAYTTPYNIDFSYRIEVYE